MYLTGLKTYLRLKHNLKKPLDVLKAQQWRAFCDLVQYAYHRVSFYRDLYDRENFSPEKLKIPADLSLVPITRKQLFQQAGLKSLFASGLNPEKLVRKRTSGSSGSPLNVYYTPGDRIYRTLLHLRILFFNGMSFRDRMAHISDSRNVPDYRYGFQTLGFLPKEFVYAADPAQTQLDRLTAIDPQVIYSYASSMVLLASEVEKRGHCPVKPRLVFTTGELLNPDDRERINQAFSVQLRDILGIVEMGDVAWQCPQLAGYHLNIDSILAEVVVDGKPAEPGQPGRLIVTNLHSRAMPFIRYEMEDVATAPRDDLCPCGCPFPRIEVLQGRADDWLYAADGHRVSPLIFVIASIQGVQQYRMIQKAYDHIIVEILPGPGCSEDTLKKAEEHVLEVMGPGLKVDVHRVDAIPMQSGKMRRVISEINQRSS